MKIFPLLALTATICACASTQKQQTDVAPPLPSTQDTAGSTTEPFFTLDRYTRRQDIVVYENDYIHVIKSQANEPLLVDKTITTTQNQADQNQAIGMFIDSALNTPGKPEKVKTGRETDVIAAWTRYCIHESITEAQMDIVESTPMPAFLTDICIDHK